MREPSSDFNSTPLTDFLRALFTEGAVAVPPYTSDPQPLSTDAECREVLRDAEFSIRAHLAGEVPVLDLDAAEWAARQFYCACQFLVCREVTAEEVTHALSLPCPCARGPSADYSVDLVFRFLPDLLDVAKRLAPEDALAASLKTWAEAWPLSSVGVVLSDGFSLVSFVDTPALLRLYTDRIAMRQAIDRLEDKRVRAQLRADLGPYPDLSAVLDKALQRATTT